MIDDVIKTQQCVIEYIIIVMQAEKISAFEVCSKRHAIIVSRFCSKIILRFFPLSGQESLCMDFRVLNSCQ
jgi:hypothetical protein